ncbi:MAG: glycoside hydrolase family 5 protein [Bifidobacteriaceae bacterium]|jgi:aryl-phospho-beta-D-glucosidase BglC (GH1 family)|nr:glycoside hydrolase family 5 protein [Bifidobacteriaceae bacterium]
MSLASGDLISIRGNQLVSGSGEPLRLRGFCLGGWMCMENFITGFPATESLMRQAVGRAAGTDRAEFFFERLLDQFFGPADAQFLADSGVNAIRIPISYRHFEDDMNPRVLRADGLARLDKAVAASAECGIYSIIDLHAVPGWQNQHWHSDNETHRPLFWRFKDFQDRVIWLWELLADHYKDNPWVAGYNLLNEPADETRAAVGPFYQRLHDAIRAVDRRHLLFVDGNTYATEFDIFSQPWDQTIYTCHDYAQAGLEREGEYPGVTLGRHYDKAIVEAKFLQRSEYARSLGLPLYVGEFGPIYTGNAARDEQLYRLLDDQLAIYRDYEVSWSAWTYKDIGLQGLVFVDPASPYGQAVAPITERKNSLAVDHWGADFDRIADILKPLLDVVLGFEDFDPYPWGAEDWVHTVVPHLLFAQPMVGLYAQIFEGLGEAELAALADSFALANCAVRQPLRDRVLAEAAFDQAGGT